MNIQTKQRTIEQFIETLSSSSPTPGGGGASAVAGSLAGALGAMVASLTIGKAKYKEFEQQNIEAEKKAKQLSLKLLSLSDKDEEAFLPLSKAYGLPKETKEQLEHRAEVMEDCLKQAAKPPFEMLEAIYEVSKLLEQLATTGSIMVLSDIAVAATIAQGSAKGASYNVYINTKMISDKQFKLQTEAGVKELLENIKIATDNAVKTAEQRLFQ